MKNRIIWLILGLSPGMGLCQKNEEMIRELFFPYREDYRFTLSGDLTEYDRYNFPKGTTHERIYYRSHDIKDSPKGSFMTFSVQYAGEKSDSTKVLKSALVLNKKGMSWWGIEREEKKKPTQAISLPLYEGRKWQTIFAGKKAELECFTTDTVIETCVGKLKSFGIRYLVVWEETAEFKVVLRFEEYYSQYIGKIHTNFARLLVDKANDRESILYSETHFLSYTNLPEDWRSKLTVVP
jgi:hypothetical protein